jgi:hypothetical protein
MVSCYSSGENTEHDRIDNAVTSFCNILGDKGEAMANNYYYEQDFPFPYNGGIGIIDITISVQVKPSCEWNYTFDDCYRYLEVPANSCNCGGVNGKQGGTVENNCLKWRMDPNVSF